MVLFAYIQTQLHNPIIKGTTLGGTALSIAGSITSADVVKTIVLAAIGAVVSFSMGLILNKLFGKK